MKKLSLFLGVMLCSTSLCQSVKGMDALSISFNKVTEFISYLLEAETKDQLEKCLLVEAETKAQLRKQELFKKYLLEKYLLETSFPKEIVLLIRRRQAAIEAKATLAQAEIEYLALQSRLGHIEKQLSDTSLPKEHRSVFMREQQTIMDETEAAQARNQEQQKLLALLQPE